MNIRWLTRHAARRALAHQHRRDAGSAVPGGRPRPYFAQARPYLLMPIWLHGEAAVMTNAIEDILVCIHDEPDHDDHTNWGE